MVKREIKSKSTHKYVYDREQWKKKLSIDGGKKKSLRIFRAIHMSKIEMNLC